MWVFVFNSFYIAWSGGTFVADWSVKNTLYLYNFLYKKQVCLYVLHVTILNFYTLYLNIYMVESIPCQPTELIWSVHRTCAKLWYIVIVGSSVKSKYTIEICQILWKFICPSQTDNRNSVRIAIGSGFNILRYGNENQHSAAGNWHRCQGRE